ncbi:uncharacterized protein FSUBG_14114 [Fusarium subglutinans]|uniref:Uncharacterized protein n=1 Tax=Gibberella subglutinans TaxID=42677 RepID=A0A8H5NPK8_GIBSU|nr:uncharacterized protein FSUBG_14114 [Fusarium subglutinans]KAF5573294.1 hypothetical protein FSUBG_14114 [Fusarium subglutinans]
MKKLPRPRQELNPPASAEAHDDVIQLTPTRDADAEPGKEDNDDLWSSLETHNIDKKTNKDPNPEPELLEPPSPAELENESKKKPHDMPLWPNNEFRILSSRNQEGSARSQSESSIFDRGVRSRATLLTTVATSLPRTKNQADPGGPIATTPGMGMEAEQPNLSPETKDACTDNSDAETSYSLDTMVDDPTTFYLQAFSDLTS